jgi:hypothetical protein
VTENVNLPYNMNCHPERSEGPAFCRNHHIALRKSTFAAIALITLSLPFTLQAQTKPAPSAKSAPAEDSLLYRNTTFAFRYQIPYGWVDRTKEMQDSDQKDATKAQVLLAVFERPPQAIGATINSAVVIASESTASYPGLKKAEDYLGPLTELATANGFKAEGEPYELEVESRALLRVDFTKTIGGKAGVDSSPNGAPANDPTARDKLTMRQCTLVMLAKGQIVSFTFIAASDEELDDLMDGLHFGAAKSPAH